MRKMSKFLVVGFVLSIIIGFFAPGINASAGTEDNDFDSQEEIEALAEELEFYFGEVGELTEDGSYIVNNPELLEERAQQGDEYAQIVYENYLRGSSEAEDFSDSSDMVTANNLGYDFARCVIDDAFGFYIGILSGDIIQTLIGFISDQAWTAAGTLIVQNAGGLIGSSTATGIAANIAVASATCGLRQVFN